MTQQIAEAGVLTPSPTSGAAGTRWRVRIIRGDVWGSSGYYPAEVVAEDGPMVFPEGTHIYIDHPGEFEAHDRPVRSVRDLAGRIASTPVYEDDGLYADVEFVSWVAPVVAELAEDIGLSIRASATGAVGERDGRCGLVIDRLIAGVSVDLVTHPGAGGRLVALIESARPETPDAGSHVIEETAELSPATEARQEGDMTTITNPAATTTITPSVWEMFEALRAPDPADVVASAVAHGVQEATANDTREALQDRLREEYGGEKSWVWVRDFDDTTVWYEHETPDESGCYAEGYTIGDDLAVTLAGDRQEVRTRTEYVPVTDSTDATETSATASETTDHVAETDTTEAAATDGPTTDPATPVTDAAEAANPSEEDNMSNTPGAGGTAPNSPRQVMEARLTEQSRQIATMVAGQRARDIVAEVLASGWISESQRARLATSLVQDVPLTEQLTLDEPVLRQRATAALETAETEAAEVLNAAGVGTPRGLGALSTPATEAANAQTSASLAESLKVFGLSDAESDIAVKGR